MQNSRSRIIVRTVRVARPVTLIWFLCVLATGCSGVRAQESGFVRTDEGVIHFRTWGEGRPILIINGGPGMNSEGFSGLAEELGLFGRTITYDQRGTGRSTLPAADLSSLAMERMIEDIDRLREYLGYESWTVLGHSFGGMLASGYTATYPDRVEGLILSSSGGIDLDLFSTLDIVGRLSSSERDSLSLWSGRIAAGDTTYHARYERGRFLAPAYVVDPVHVPTIAHRLTQGNSRINRMVIQGMRQTGFDAAPGLSKFSGHALIIQGDEDIIPVEVSRRAHEVIANSELIVLERSGHYGWLDRPDAYFAAIERFMGRLD